MSTQIEGAPTDVLEIVPIGGKVGAKVKGIRLSGQLGETEIASIKTALAEQSVGHPHKRS